MKRRCETVQSPVLLKWMWAYGSAEDLVKMQILMQEVGSGAHDCLSNQLPGGAVTGISPAWEAVDASCGFSLSGTASLF